MKILQGINSFGTMYKCPYSTSNGSFGQLNWILDSQYNQCTKLWPVVIQVLDWYVLNWILHSSFEDSSLRGFFFIVDIFYAMLWHQKHVIFYFNNNDVEVKHVSFSNSLTRKLECHFLNMNVTNGCMVALNSKFNPNI